MDCGGHMNGGNFHYFQMPLTVPLHSPNGRPLPAISAVQGDCERVYEMSNSNEPL